MIIPPFCLGSELNMQDCTKVSQTPIAPPAAGKNGRREKMEEEKGKMEEDASVCAGLKAMDISKDSYFQEDDKEPTKEDKDFAHYFRVGDVVEFKNYELVRFCERTDRSICWGRVVAIEGGWVTIQTGKNEKSLLKAHAKSLCPFLNSEGMHFVEPSTGRVVRILCADEHLEYIPNFSSNPWVRLVLFESGEKRYQDLRLWQRKETLDFVDDFDDFSGYHTFLMQFRPSNTFPPRRD